MARVKPKGIGAEAGRAPLLTRLGLDRPELRAWALYDFANSAAVTSVITAVYPIYYGSVAARGLAASEATQCYAVATTIALVLVAFLSPIVGAFADVRPWKKSLLAGFALLGAAATAALWFVRGGDWRLGSVLFVLANIGLNGSFVFYDALLPHIAREDELDRVSTAGYALGYLGGGVLLAAQLLVILSPSLLGIHPAGPGRPRRRCRARLAFLSRRSGGSCSRSRCSAASPSPRRRERTERRGAGRSGARATAASARCASSARYRAGAPDAAAPS